MPKFYLRFKARDFTDTFVPPQVDFRVESFAWMETGGPDKAFVEARGDLLDLWQLADMLRLPVELYDEFGVAVWWGYVHAVTLHAGRYDFGLSLDNMANRVSIAYTRLAAGSSGAGKRATTAWASDSQSAGEFGTKERTETLNEAATDAVAEAARDRMLATWKYPQPTMQPASASEIFAELDLRGWWWTLDWQHYSNAATASVQTTTQIGTMVGASGQFILGVDVEQASGINSNEYKDGDASTLRSAEELFKIGSTGGGRLLAAVTQARRLRIFAEPGESAPRFTMRTDGELYDAQALVPPWTVPVGEWVQLEGVIPDTLNVSRLANAGKLFISAADYDCGAGRWSLTTRNSRAPFDVSPGDTIQLRDQKDMQPYVMKWVGGEGVGGGGFAPSPHNLDGADHAGLLGDAQAPQFLLLDGSRSMTGPVKFGVVPDVEIGRKSVDTLQLGNNDQLEATTFTSGLAGFRIGANGDAEFNNVVARGEFRASVFTIGEVHADGGTRLILEASTLAEQVTTL